MPVMAGQEATILETLADPDLIQEGDGRKEDPMEAAPRGSHRLQMASMDPALDVPDSVQDSDHVHQPPASPFLEYEDVCVSGKRASRDRRMLSTRPRADVQLDRGSKARRGPEHPWDCIFR